ncbi:MAG: alpha/beta fold hydrolase, partial [Candidatus Diapherotrites archaeon]
RIEKVEFITEDGVKIIGNLYKADKKALILMHQFKRDKSSYSSLQEKLAKAGFSSIAIDLRGHGESLEQKGIKRPYTTFVEADFRDMEKDAKATKKFLESQGYQVYAVIGASIGANTALNFCAKNEDIQKCVLLSPGLNYKGISTEESASSVKSKTMIVVSSEDEYSLASSRALAKKISNAELKELKNAGHGTDMFKPTNLENELVEWLKK